MITSNDDTHSEVMQDQLEPIPFTDKPTTKVQSPPPPSGKFSEKDTIVIGADHRGYLLKEHIKVHALKEMNLQIIDLIPQKYRHQQILTISI